MLGFIVGRTEDIGIWEPNPSPPSFASILTIIIIFRYATAAIRSHNAASSSSTATAAYVPSWCSCSCYVSGVVISDVGIPNLVQWDWLKPGAVVVDMGTNPVKDLSSRHGFRITGDVCYKDAIKVVSAITPVPGGVGPVVISMLLSNTLDSAKRAFGLTFTKKRWNQVYGTIGT